MLPDKRRVHGNLHLHKLNISEERTGGSRSPLSETGLRFEGTPLQVEFPQPNRDRGGILPPRYFTSKAGRGSRNCMISKDPEKSELKARNELFMHHVSEPPIISRNLRSGLPAPRWLPPRHRGAKTAGGLAGE